ncbi:MAG: hypothetical protein R3B40_07910 [Polyangiales bacterium]
MLTASCGACGRPRPVSLATPDALACPCGWTGTPSPELWAAIERATAQLRALHDQRVQSAQVTRKAGATQLVETLRVWNGVIVLGGALSVSVFMALLFMDDPSPATVGFCAGPLLLLFPMVAVAVLFTRHARNKPAPMPTVLPPEDTRAPPRCHLCGAPVQIPERAATVRCGFCQTDNVVDARALVPQQLAATSESEHAARVASFANALADRSFSARRALFVASVAAVLAGPPLGCVLGMLFSAVAR